MSWYAKCSLFRGSKKALPWPLETITGPTSCVKRKMYWITKSSQHCILQIAKRAFSPHRECISWVLVPQLLEWASLYPDLRMHLGIQFQLSIARAEQNHFIAASMRKSRAKTAVVGFKRWIIIWIAKTILLRTMNLTWNLGVFSHKKKTKEMNIKDSQSPCLFIVHLTNQ